MRFPAFPDGLSAYRFAVDLTISTIEKRAILFRNQIAMTVIVSVPLILSAAVTLKLWPLSGMLFIIPICGTFILYDGIYLMRWRSTILGLWASQMIDLQKFNRAVRANKALPENGLNSMLELICENDSQLDEPATSACMRRSIVEFVELMDRSALHRLFRRLILSCVFTINAVLLLAFNTLVLGLLATTLLAPILMIANTISYKRRCRILLATAMRCPEFDAGVLLRWCKFLSTRRDWNSNSSLLTEALRIA